MGKLVVCMRRFLLLCTIVLLLPSLAAAQCVSQLTVQRVWARDTGGNDKANFAPGETIQFLAQLNNSYGAYLLGANGTKVTITTSFYNDTKPVDIPPGSSTRTWNATTPYVQGNYTVTVRAYDHFCGVWVERSSSFAVGLSTGTTVTLEQALTHNGDGTYGQEQTIFNPGDVIRYAAIVNNPSGSTVTPRFDFRASGPREIFSWTADVAIAPGEWYFHLHVSVPTDAPQGTYTHRVTMTYNGQTSTKESSFTVTPVSAPLFRSLRNPIFAGWSAHPANDDPVTKVEGQWIVPEVDCQALTESRPWRASRAAPWVGIWGKSNDYKITWLAQIGTSSECAKGGQSQAFPEFKAFKYQAVWELLHTSSNYHDPGPSTLFDVQPGDSVTASVSYYARRPDNTRLFEVIISVTDKNGQLRGSQTKQFQTDPDVDKDDAAWQGGCIVEALPDGYSQNPNYEGPIGGLARFTTPIQFSRCTVNGKELATYSGYETLFRWDMKWPKELDSKLALADTGSPGQNGAFSVTWQHWHSPAPDIWTVETFRQGVLVYFRARFTDSDGDAEGFGFKGINGSPFAEESHPFSSPSYGIVSYTRGEANGFVAYPFNLGCGTTSEFETDVEVWIYDSTVSTGLRSEPKKIHLSCSAPPA